MKVSELWLREWVNPSITVDKLAAQLTMAGLEVDSVAPVAAEFHGVIVAEVMATSRHPEADKLTLCEVNSGEGPLLKIVCGAANVRAGLKVALATMGAKLPGNITIKETKLRGELSQGMLCSVSELGMAEQSDGILELDKDAPVGMNIRDYLALDDNVLDIDLTPNRADCFSVLGVAREVAAINKLPLAVNDHKAVLPAIDDQHPVQLKAKDACPVYCGRIIKGINPHAETPVWLAERLRRAGLRTLHPVVDVTNYVMMELGQPMHAFDLNTLEGEIQVRFAKEGEKLTLLDGQEVELSPQVLVIADAKKSLAMAGIMGGEDSAVQADTVDIFLESAYFNPLALAGVGRRYGLCTDSSQRFERGVDPELQLIAMERATAILQPIVGGKAGPLTIATHNENKPKAKKITFNPQKVEQLSGLNIPVDEIKALLQALGMDVVTRHPECVFLREGSPKSSAVPNITRSIAQKDALWMTSLEVVIPSYRFDISLDVDLVEEVIRLYGYDHLPALEVTAAMQAGVTNAVEALGVKFAQWFQSRGYHESISYSFVDPQLQSALYPEEESMQLVNPISSEMSQMRLGMWSGLIASMIYNAHRQQSQIKLIESGVIFKVAQGQLEEIPCLAGLITGEQGSLNWSEPTRFVDFFDLKGDVDSFLASLHIKADYQQQVHPALHPGQSAQIMKGNQLVGWIGVLHPRLADELGINQDVVLFELYTQALVQTDSPKYQPISRYPQIRRDLSFLVAKEVTALHIEQAVREVVKNNWLKSFHVFDLYTGKGIPEDKKSLAIAMILQDTTRTFVDSEINDLISAIINKLHNEFSITLRD